MEAGNFIALFFFPLLLFVCRGSLLLRCWARSAQHRPTACEIVEILANDNSLISPCLDLPLASVQVEGPDSLELTAISDRNRLHSISSLGRKVDQPPVDCNRTTLVNAAVQMPGSPPPLPRNQYVTLRQTSRNKGCDGVPTAAAQIVTPL